MSKDRTYASDIETEGDPAKLAERRSIDAEKATRPKSRKEQDEQDRAASLANAEGQTGQT